ncbi:MAG: PAS domain S-box protein [Deltaproteobacteria bacterium]|nr:PAS domain S-box protein [Deltaproteobacteria bacterium]
MKSKDQAYREGKLNRLKAQNQSLKEKGVSLKREIGELKKGIRNRDLLFHSIPAGIVLVQHGRIVEVNRSALDQLGYAREDIIGAEYLDFVDPDRRGDERDMFRKRVSGKWVPLQYETELVTASGVSRGFDVQVEKIRYQGRRAFIAMFSPAESRKRKEKALVQQKKTEAVMTMASGLTRKFSTSLEILVQTLASLREGPAVEDRGLHAGLERMILAARELEETTRTLDSLTRQEQDRSGLTLLDLKGIIREAVKTTESRIRERAERRDVGINLKTYLRSVSPVEGNPEEIRDVIVNMILNAVEAMPEGGDLYLSIEENAGYAHIYIQDSGIGIPEQINHRILDPFFTTKGDQGIGLGLSLSYAVIKRHRGDIEFRGEKGKGTFITIRLPLAEGKKKPKKGSARLNIRGTPILIIEGDDMIRELLSQVFRAKGFGVATAGGGLEGLMLLRKKRPGMLIADFGTPEVGRDIFFRNLKKAAPDLPVALIMDHGDRERGKSLKRFHPDLIIDKPIDMNRIVFQVADFLAQR